MNSNALHKITLFTLLTLNLCLSTQAIDIAMTFEPGMKYLEYHLIMKPRWQVKTENDNFTAIGAMTTAGYAISRIQKDGTIPFNTMDILRIGFCAGIISTLYHKFVASFRMKAIYTKHLIQFIENWEHHKKCTPEQFHELFDSLAQALETQGISAVQEHATEVINLISFHLSHIYPNRYKKVEYDITNTYKAASDIAKNLNDLTR